MTLPETRPMLVLEARSLAKTYGSGELRVEALRGVDLKVQQGEFLAIMGPSGSGKSTLLHLLGGVDTPSSGQVLLEGADLGQLSDNQRTIIRRQRIGFIFQSFNLLPTLSAEENVALPLELDWHGGGDGAAAGPGRAGSRRHGPPPQPLSRHALRRRAAAGGRRPRLAIEPALLLADEPTGNLDSGNGRQITMLLRRLVDQRRQTIVMVTHDRGVAAQADRLICLRDGLIESDREQSLVDRGGAEEHRP